MSPTEQAQTCKLSDRVMALKPSSTLAVTAKVKAMLAAGVDVVGFGAGEPDFDTPPHIKQAAIAALEAGRTKYEPNPGTPEARAAVARYMNSRHGFDVKPENVIISVGGKCALYLAFMALVNPGDEVLLPAPYWVTYPEQAQLAGAAVKELPTTVESGFKITPAQLEAGITPKSRVLVLNSPNNPTGTMYTPDELRALAEVVVRHPNLTVFADDIYERLVYGDAPFAAFATLRPELFAQTVTFNCLSKSYAMTGWRIGFTVADARIIKAMDALQGQMTSNITSFAMAAIATALDGPQDDVERMRQAFAARGQHMYERLSHMSGVKCARPTGAFYVFPDISGLLGRRDGRGNEMKTAADLASSLLEEARVAIVPGEDFGAPTHIRFSFATSMARINEGLDRFERWIGTLT